MVVFCSPLQQKQHGAKTVITIPGRFKKITPKIISSVAMLVTSIATLLVPVALDGKFLGVLPLF